MITPEDIQDTNDRVSAIAQLKDMCGRVSDADRAALYWVLTELPRLNVALMDARHGAR